MAFRVGQKVVCIEGGKWFCNNPVYDNVGPQKTDGIHGRCTEASPVITPLSPCPNRRIPSHDTL